MMKAKGFVMVTIFFVILMGFTVSLFSVSVSNRQRNQMKINQIQAQYYAESLIDTVQYLLSNQLNHKQSLQVIYEIGSSAGAEIILPLDSAAVYTGDPAIDFETIITEAVLLINQRETANRYASSLTGAMQILDKEDEGLKLHNMDKNGDMLNASTLVGGELSPVDYYFEVEYLGGAIGCRFRFSEITFHLVKNDIPADGELGELIYSLSTDNMQIITTYFNVRGR